MIKIGTRGSNLALAQTSWVKQQIISQHPSAEIQFEIIHTSADKDQQRSIRSGSATGVFVKEIEEALLSEKIDIAVHSMKDLPTKLAPELDIACIPPREDARDAVILRNPSGKLEDLHDGASIGTGSIRRQAQLLAMRPDLEIRGIRGNVDTRLRKLMEEDYDAIILACAGLNRLGLDSKINQRLSFTSMLPAPGQGALAIETRIRDKRVYELVSEFHHEPTATAIRAERAFLSRMGGGCNSPIGVYAKVEDNTISIVGLVAAPDGSEIIKSSMLGNLEEGPDLAGRLADSLLSRGGTAILDTIR